MIKVICSTEREMKGILVSLHQSGICPFLNTIEEDNCEDESTCLSCLKRNIEFILEDN